MKSFAPDALDALEAGTAIVSGAVAVLSDPPVRAWGGHGVLTIDGEDFDGVGDRGLAQLSGGSLGGAAQNITLTLSGIDPVLLELLDADELRGAPTIVWRLIFNGAGTTMLDAHVFTRGRLDQLPTEEVIGGEAVIKAMIESAAQGLGRHGGRMRTDADQRLIKPADGSFKAVSYAAEKMLYLGGKRPAAAGTVLGGG